MASGLSCLYNGSYEDFDDIFMQTSNPNFIDAAAIGNDLFYINDSLIQNRYISKNKMTLLSGNGYNTGMVVYTPREYLPLFNSNFGIWSREKIEDIGSQFILKKQCSSFNNVVTYTSGTTIDMKIPSYKVGAVGVEYFNVLLIGGGGGGGGGAAIWKSSVQSDRIGKKGGSATILVKLGVPKEALHGAILSIGAGGAGGIKSSIVYNFIINATQGGYGGASSIISANNDVNIVAPGGTPGGAYPYSAEANQYSAAATGGSKYITNNTEIPKITVNTTTEYCFALDFQNGSNFGVGGAGGYKENNGTAGNPGYACIFW